MNKQKRGGIFKCRPASVAVERYFICAMLHALKELETGDKKQLLVGVVQLLRAAQNNLSSLAPRADAARLPGK